MVTAPDRPTLTAVALEPDHPAIRSLAERYYARFKLGPLPEPFGKDRVWTGVLYGDRVIAVFGERGDPSTRTLAVLDAYCEPNTMGWAALRAGVRRYYQMLQAGDYSAVRHSVSWSNKRFLRFVLELTGDEPVGLVFEHRRKE
jgi:hypothetical protein